MIREYHCFGNLAIHKRPAAIYEAPQRRGRCRQEGAADAGKASDPAMHLLATVFGFRWW
jgi:hypothetical protein